jgi:hypothetical protein
VLGKEIYKGDMMPKMRDGRTRQSDINNQDWIHSHQLHCIQLPYNDTP